jgi:hypothetical protein
VANKSRRRTHAIPQVKSRFEAEQIFGMVLEVEKKGHKFGKPDKIYNANLDYLNQES